MVNEENEEGLSQMGKSYDLCCFSFISALELLQIERLPKANAGVAVIDIFGEVTPDGPIAALLASYLGMKVGFIGNDVGNDPSGQQLKHLLDRFAISSTLKIQEELSTPRTVVLCDQQENRTWFSFLPHSLDSLLSASTEMIELSQLAYIDLYDIIKSASRRAIRAANQQGIPLFINLGGDDLSEQDVTLLRDAHVAIIQTSLDVGDHRKPDEYAKKLHDLIQPEITIITLARKGLVYATASVIKQIPAYVVPVLHCCGAGAAFSAGFAYAYLHQWDLIKALRFASALGGLYCTVKNGFGVFSSRLCS